MRWIWLVVTVLLAAGCSPGSGDSPAPTAAPAPTTAGSRPPTTAPGTPTMPIETVPTTAVPGTSTPVTSTTTPPPDPLRSLRYESVVEVGFPSVMVARPGDGILLLATRGGIISMLMEGELGEVVLDMSAQTTTDGERGLLGMAFHPGDGSRLFVHYTDRAGDTKVSEFSVDGVVADPDSERVLLAVDQPASNHNGGMIQFGADGALYLGLGDGGGSGDRFGNAQNTDTLLGGLVRIDVDSGESQLWQYGLRNPWRFWIDGENVWIADVGQGSFEEVNLAPLAEQGLNYGWPITEGLHCYQSAECDTDGLMMPIAEVEHGDAGTCSITGGAVYRGGAIPEVDGRYFFSDYCGGWLRSSDRTGDVVDHTPEVGVAGQVVSFGLDAAGELYVLTTEEVLQLMPVRSRS